MSNGKTTSSNTPYDDVFRTLLNDCSSLIIPVINEVFGEDYRGDEEVLFYPNEHFIQGQDTSTKEKITDSCFQVIGIRKKKYHLECQSTTDNKMIVRMFEYDTQIALDAGEVVQGTLTVEFPHSAVLYLRHNSRTPDAMTVRIKTPSGEIFASIMELLEEHGTVPDGLRTCIQEEKDMEVLKLYLKKASRVQSVEEFEQWVLKERNKKM